MGEKNTIGGGMTIEEGDSEEEVQGRRKRRTVRYSILVNVMYRSAKASILLGAILISSLLTIQVFI